MHSFINPEILVVSSVHVCVYVCMCNESKDLYGNRVNPMHAEVKIICVLGNRGEDTSLFPRLTLFY